MSLKTEGVDISPEAVERAASGAELNGQRWLAEMLRELSRSLTASEQRHEQIAEDIKAIARELWADDQTYVSDELLAILAKGEAK